MIDEADLFEEADPGFEESIRIDREVDFEDAAGAQEQRYRQYLDTYHLTDASVDFLEDLLARIRDPDPASEELNHWLYGYYGSGKSHLLTALDLLLDSSTLSNSDMDAVWDRFDERPDDPDGLEDAWHSLHEEYLVVPVPINLLRYQGVREQSFSEIILQTIYQRRGFSDRLDVAFFEEEFQREGGLFDTRSVWENRERYVEEILREEGVPNPEYDWADVQRYSILSDIVLEGMTERATGMTENLEDIQSRNIGQQLAVDTLESYRQSLEAEHDRPVKLVLLMDEVTLFMGDNTQRIGELNALAESIEKVGGDILTVVTAQSKIEEAQPETATKVNEMGWLTDRFDEYPLPSRHVGEIVQQRLLAKSTVGVDWVQEEALNAPVHPGTLKYTGGNQNTSPPLDDIDEEKFVEYYPLLPYQPALFLQILSNLRTELADRSKSIFSGTARAILALVAGLREEMARKDQERPIVSLVDFYDLIQYELQDIIPGKIEVIESIEDDPATTEFDLDVAKAVLLLSYVPDLVPQTDANLAVAVMGDLDGSLRSQVTTKIREALDGELERYIRPDTATDGGKLRISEPDEQRMLAEAREYETDPDWEAIIDALDEDLWVDIIAELELPETYAYGEADEDDVATYPVGYQYVIDDKSLSTGETENAVFSVDVFVRGLLPDIDDDSIDPDTLYWLLDDDDLDDLRSQLVDWWALRKATRATTPPESIARDLDDAADRVVDKFVAALDSATHRVEASSFDSFEAALEDYIDEAYPDYFHPELFRVDDSHLSELERLDEDADLPEWAKTIGVPPQTADIATFSDISFQVRKLVASEIQEADSDIDLATILDRAIEKESLFAFEEGGERSPSPAMLAVLWGLCRAGVFRVVTVEGEPAALNDLLTPRNHPDIALRPVSPGTRPKEVFVDHDLIPPTASENRGYIVLNELLEEIENRADSLAEEARVKDETTFETDALSTLVVNLAEEATDIANSAKDRQSDATTDDTDRLEEIVNGAVQDQDWLDTAEEQWDERLAHLLQLEGLVRLGASEIEWVNNSFIEDIEQLTQQLDENTDAKWWTQDGWRSLYRDLDARGEAIESLSSAWSTQQEETELAKLQSALEDHPWLIEPMELPDRRVHDNFRLQYLDPLRSFRATLDRIGTAVDSLTDQEPGAGDEGRLIETLGRLENIDWSEPTETTVETHRETWETLDGVVGNTGPSDVTGIGVLHGDAEALKAQLEQLDMTDETLDIDEEDGGVILR